MKTTNNPKIEKNIFDKINKKEKGFTNFKMINGNGETAAMHVFFCNELYNIKLTPEEIDYLVRHSDLKYRTSNQNDLLMYALKNNDNQKLNLTPQTWDYLIKNSEIGKSDDMDWSALDFAIIKEDEEKLQLTREQWNYLVENSDLSKRDIYNRNSILRAVEYKKYDVAVNILERMMDKTKYNFNFDDYLSEIEKAKNRRLGDTAVCNETRQLIEVVKAKKMIGENLKNKNIQISVSNKI